MLKAGYDLKYRETRLQYKRLLELTDGRDPEPSTPHTTQFKGHYDKINWRNC